ncbi:hypothetical protein Gotri_020508, partial [Gossypium trilobum]|nr:hypothetical protein [Gossypium trilobum]
NFRGEELEPLSLRDLQLLEQQIGNSLKRIRTRKNKLMNESISVLQKRVRSLAYHSFGEKTLQDQNNMLAKKVKNYYSFLWICSSMAYILVSFNAFLPWIKLKEKQQTPTEHAQHEVQQKFVQNSPPSTSVQPPTPPPAAIQFPCLTIGYFLTLFSLIQNNVFTC